jgi:predicted  nucleic acid-binding Zn-ribbon protein
MLTKKDLENIKDLIEFSATQSERRIENRFDNLENRFDNLENRFDNLENRFDNLEKEVKDFRSEMYREISDIAETNREFLAKLDNHEKRINKLEFETGLATE